MTTSSETDITRPSGAASTRAPREQKKYVRRRYTDTRHPTRELPDLRVDQLVLPPDATVQNPPLKRQIQRQQQREQELAVNDE
jgi:hypothetical protein